MPIKTPNEVIANFQNLNPTEQEIVRRFMSSDAAPVVAKVLGFNDREFNGLKQLVAAPRAGLATRTR